MAGDGEQRPQQAAPGAARRPGWRQWQVDPDSLWPGFGVSPGQPVHPHADRRDLQQRQQGRRPPDRIRPRLTRDEIVDAAVAVADAEGAEALSMRRIAQVLRAGTMSLYWHVANKEHLLDLMRDMLMAEVEVPEPSGDWRADMRAIATSNRAMLRRHRWLMDFIGDRPSLGPNTLLSLERALATLAPLNLGPTVAFNILTAVNTYVVGAVLREVQEIKAQQAERAAGLDAGQESRERDAWRNQIAATGLFPNFVRFLDTGIDPDALETMDERFEFGLDCLLDGIATRISG